MPDTIRELLEEILAKYNKAREQDSFGKSHPIWSVFKELQNHIKSYVDEKSPTIKVNWSIGQGNWARIPWIAFLDERETSTTQKGIYCVFLFRQDMSGVYITFNQGVTEPKDKLGAAKGRNFLQTQAQNLRKQYNQLETAGYSLDDNIDLRVQSGLGADYECSTIAYKFYSAGNVPQDNLILKDIDVLLKAYENYVSTKESNNKEEWMDPEVTIQRDSNNNVQIDKLINYIFSQGYVYEPWQIAAYVVALRTKPFIILAGVTGTGKSKLPALVSRATGGDVQLISVRPDWTDSSDILGYCDLQGNFRPGPLLEIVKEAEENKDKHYVCIIDEMNLARVEHYFAEILSRIEDRELTSEGGYKSGPLLVQKLNNIDRYWSELGLPPNLALVGTVNMDESTHGFSRKVLDRAFTIELSEIDLAAWEAVQTSNIKYEKWPVSVWYPRAIQLGKIGSLADQERDKIKQVVQTLSIINGFLTQAHCQIGYRTRDEIAMFVLHANEVLGSFVTRTGEQVDPLDLALQMKILPRIAGGSTTIRRSLLQLLGFSYKRQPFNAEEEASALIDRWKDNDCPSALIDAQFPRTAARLCLMWDRMVNEGFTSYWL